MATSADVAVVVCSRNRAELLANALARIATVTPDAVRVLVVDSASSTWATRDVARAAGVEVIRTDVRGLSIARNLGLEHADRPIVVYTDDDCEPDEGWIDRIIEPFSDPGIGAVTGLLLDQSLAAESFDKHSQVYTTFVRGLDAGHGALMAFRRELLDRLGGFDEVLGAGRRFAGAEDLDMFCRVLASGASIVHEPRSIVRHINTREDEAYVELLHGYGLGLGGLITKWLKLSPGRGLRLGTIATGRSVMRYLRRLGSKRRRRGQGAMLRGIFAGMVISARFALDGTRFVDAHPPEPTPVGGGRSESGSPR